MSFDQDQITLEHIGRTIFDTAAINLRDEEASTLHALHSNLFNTGQIDTVLDLFNFCNFNRDCVVPLEQILNILFT